MTKKNSALQGGKKRQPYDPTATEYFKALPSGWLSYPTCQARSAFLMSLRERGVVAQDALPEELHHVLTMHVDAEGWLPEVLQVASMLAVRDARFGHGPEADSAFLAWTTQLNRDLFAHADYAKILAQTTADELVPRLPQVWASFHRGTPLVVTSQGPNRASCELSHPTLLFTPLSLESHRRAFAILLAKAGAAQPSIKAHTQVQGDMSTTVLEATWG
jgi:hypothetical protein